MSKDWEFQSTRPIRGATKYMLPSNQGDYISIHAPHTGRDLQPQTEIHQNRISIHAPHTGRDSTKDANRAADKQFQSTRPIRGATLPPQMESHRNRISIHAPHTGRDSSARSRSFLSISFQSTRPIRGATQYGIRCKLFAVHFNPRAPYGARRHNLTCSSQMRHFNPRAPYGARPSRRRQGYSPFRYFNPRAPYGARHLCTILVNVLDRFQSTRPIRGATTRYSIRANVTQISIHAPHTGRDLSRG